MIFQAALLALVAPLVCATIVLQAPNGTVRTDSPVTFTWTSTDNADPPFFSLVLQRTSFHNTYAIANNVLTTSESISLTIPTVPVGDGYTLQAVNISDINNVYSNFGPFSIDAALSTTSSGSTASGASSSATLPPGLSTSSGASSAGTATGTGSGSAVSPSNTVTSAGTTPGTTTGTQTANTGTSTPFNNGANQVASSYTALALSAIAGITFLAL